jgi:hypothetical protein
MNENPPNALSSTRQCKASDISPATRLAFEVDRQSDEQRLRAALGAHGGRDDQPRVPSCGTGPCGPCASPEAGDPRSA